VVLAAGITADQLWRCVDAIHDEIKVTIVVKITESAAAGCGRGGNSRSRQKRNVFEVIVAQIAVEQFALRITCFGGELFDLRIDVAVAEKNVWPAVVIKIKKAAAPTQILGVLAEAGRKCCIFESGAAKVVIKRRRVSRKIRFYDVKIAVHVV